MQGQLESVIQLDLFVPVTGFISLFYKNAFAGILLLHAVRRRSTWAFAHVVLLCSECSKVVLTCHNIFKPHTPPCLT